MPAPSARCVCFGSAPSAPSCSNGFCRACQRSGPAGRRSICISTPPPIWWISCGMNITLRSASAAGSGWGLHAEKVLEEWLVPVCAPALLKRCGALKQKQDLKRYPLLHSTSEPWSYWLLRDEGAGPPERTGSATFDDSVAVVRMAQRGQGLALARWTLVADEIQSGALGGSGSGNPLRPGLLVRVSTAPAQCGAGQGVGRMARRGSGPISFTAVSRRIAQRASLLEATRRRISAPFPVYWPQRPTGYS